MLPQSQRRKEMEVNVPLCIQTFRYLPNYEFLTNFRETKNFQNQVKFHLALPYQLRMLLEKKRKTKMKKKRRVMKLRGCWPLRSIFSGIHCSSETIATLSMKMNPVSTRICWIMKLFFHCFRRYLLLIGPHWNSFVPVVSVVLPRCRNLIPGRIKCNNCNGLQSAKQNSISVI